MRIIPKASSHSYLKPNWPAPAQVNAFQTTRQGGFSSGAHASFSLGGQDPFDNEQHQTANQKKLLADLTINDTLPLWLHQTHGHHVIDKAANTTTNPEADACYSLKANVICAVRTADCLPILLCDRKGSMVAAIHSGWKSLLGGIIEATIAALPTHGSNLLAWLGPAIGPNQFEITEDVRQLFIADNKKSTPCFVQKKEGVWFANLYHLAKQRLLSAGVENIYGGEYCTYSQDALFFSYRRDKGQTGRMASLIWLE